MVLARECSLHLFSAQAHAREHIGEELLAQAILLYIADTKSLVNSDIDLAISF